MAEKRMREVFIPKKSKTDTERYVSVNGENMLLQTGKVLSVPEKFALVIEESQRRDNIAAAFIEANANN
ncbi:MAG: hypothetical protein IJ499_00025 [Clostridia bacterium]|nr:hypothetical protein [Clostridia bacterium]